MNLSSNGVHVVKDRYNQRMNKQERDLERWKRKVLMEKEMKEFKDRKGEQIE